jgi:hypothetical protein
MPVKPAKTEQIRPAAPPIKQQAAPKAGQIKPTAPPSKAEQAKPASSSSISSSPIMQNTGKRVPISGIDTNDPNIVALISVLCTFLASAPGVGYVILGYTRKALIYTVGTWAVIFVLAIVVFALSIVTMGIGSICMFPLILAIFVIDIVIIWDVYCMAKGEKSKLPDF